MTTPPDLTTALAELALMLWQHEESLASWAERNPGGLFFPDDFIACAKRRAAAAWKIHDRLRAGRASEDETVKCDCYRYERQVCDVCQGVSGTLPPDPTPPPAGARDEDVAAVREALDVLPDEDSVTHRAAVDALDRTAARLAQAERKYAEREEAIKAYHASWSEAKVRLARYEALARRAKAWVDAAQQSPAAAQVIVYDLAALEETR